MTILSNHLSKSKLLAFKDEKARLSHVMVTMLQKMEVNAETFVDSLGPVSEIL